MTREDLARKIIEVIDAYSDKKLDMIATIEAICKQAIDEPMSEDLEEAGRKWLKPQLEEFYMNYGEDKAIELTRFSGYNMLDAIEFGANWQLQQMMKNAICTTMQEDDCGDIVPTIANQKGFKVGDKVKVIIVKE